MHLKLHLHFTRTEVSGVPNCVNMCDLEDIGHHIYDRTSSIQRMLDLTGCPQNRITNLRQELFALEKLLEEFERCVCKQKEKLKHLKEHKESFQNYFEDVKHIKDNIPAHMPEKKGTTNEFTNSQNEAADVHQAQLENVRKTNKSFVRAIKLITVPEFESIPQYMKGIVSYDQLNSVVQSINTAVTAKYKILHQSMKTLNSHTRKLHKQFKDQETKDTRGQYFVVEDDIREFCQIKVDKRFQRILTMLRHCQRLRELRGGGLTRYMLL